MGIPEGGSTWKDITTEKYGGCLAPVFHVDDNCRKLEIGAKGGGG